MDVYLSDETELSGRQREVLRLAAMGHTDKHISEILSISPWTIRSYWDRLRQRLNASSRTQAVAVFASIEITNLEARLASVYRLMHSMEDDCAIVIEGEYRILGKWFARASLGEAFIRGEGVEVVEEIGSTLLVRASAPSRKPPEGNLEAITHMMDTLPEPAWIAHPDGNVVYCNPWWETFSGLPHSAFAGVGCARLIHPDDAPLSRTRWRDACQDLKPYEADVLYQSANGNYQPHRINVRPLFDAKGSVACWIGYATLIASAL